MCTLYFSYLVVGMLTAVYMGTSSCSQDRKNACRSVHGSVDRLGACAVLASPRSFDENAVDDCTPPRSPALRPWSQPTILFLLFFPFLTTHIVVVG